MSRQHHKVAVGLLPCHTTLTAHLFKLRLTQRQDCPPVWELQNKIVYIFHIIVRHWHAKIRNNGSYVFDAQGSRKHEVNGLTSLVVNTRLGIMP
jgi:hypothetical protein